MPDKSLSLANYGFLGCSISVQNLRSISQCCCLILAASIGDLLDEVKARNGIYEATGGDRLAVTISHLASLGQNVVYTGGFQEGLKTAGKKGTVAASSLEMSFSG